MRRRPQVLQRLFAIARAGAFAGRERALEGQDVGGRWLVGLGDGGDGGDDAAFAVKARGRGGERVFIILVVAGGFIRGETGGSGGDFGGDGLIERGQRRDGRRLQGGDDGGAREQMGVGEVGPARDFQRAPGILGLEGAWRIARQRMSPLTRGRTYCRCRRICGLRTTGTAFGGRFHSSL